LAVQRGAEALTLKLTVAQRPRAPAVVRRR